MEAAKKKEKQDLLEVLEQEGENINDYDIESAHASSESDLERHFSPD